MREPDITEREANAFTLPAVRADLPSGLKPSFLQKLTS